MDKWQLGYIKARKQGGAMLLSWVSEVLAACKLKDEGALRAIDKYRRDILANTPRKLKRKRAAD
jgi:hypothetical protein